MKTKYYRYKKSYFYALSKDKLLTLNTHLHHKDMNVTNHSGLTDLMPEDGYKRITKMQFMMAFKKITKQFGIDFNLFNFSE